MSRKNFEPRLLSETWMRSLFFLRRAQKKKNLNIYNTIETADEDHVMWLAVNQDFK